MSNNKMNNDLTSKSKIKLSHKIRAFSKVNASIISMTIIYCLVAIVMSFYMITIVNAEFKKTENPSMPLGFELKLPFDTSRVAYYEDFAEFALGSYSFDHSVDHYCAQHGVDWATRDYNDVNKVGYYGNEYHFDNLTIERFESEDGQIIGNRNLISGYGSNWDSSDPADYVFKSGTLDSDGQLIVTNHNSPPYIGLTTDSPIYIDDNFIVHGISTTLEGHEDASSEDGKIQIWTGWVYEPLKFRYHSNYFNSDGSITPENFESDTPVVTGVTGLTTSTTYVNNLGFAYMIATMKLKSNPNTNWAVRHPQDNDTGSTKEYPNDEISILVYNWLGIDTTGEFNTTYQFYKLCDYLDAAGQVEDYNEASETPDVTAYPDESVGTVIDDSNTTYTVGPFEMSNYVMAKDTAVTGISGITNVQELFNYGRGRDYSKLADEQKLTSGSETEKDYLDQVKGDVIEVIAVLTNGDGDTKDVKINEAVLSDGTVVDVSESAEQIRNKEFSVIISAADALGYDELKELKFLYQRIGVVMDGKFYDEFNGLTELYPSSEETGCTTYSGTCDVCGEYSETKYDLDAGGWLPCETHYYDAGGEWIDDEYYPDWQECSCTQIYFTCTEHDHEDCDETEHSLSNLGELQNGCDREQDGITLNAELVPEQMYYIVEANVPMKTRMVITKGITKTWHPGEDSVIYDTFKNGVESEDRLRDLDTLYSMFNNSTEKLDGNESQIGMTREYKKNNAIKVERGDYIIFKVKVKNDSRFGTIVKLKDLIFEEPEPSNVTEYTLADANSGEIIIYYNPDEVDDELENGETSAITVNAGETKEYVAWVRTRENSGTYTNKVEFTTTNHGTEHMKYDAWGDPPKGGESTYWKGSDKLNRNGNIVNIYAKDIIGTTDFNLEEDSDTFTIKEYDIDVDKYIYDVEHKNTEAYQLAGIDTTFDNSYNRSVIREDSSRYESTFALNKVQENEKFKEGAPVYVEYGDIITYYIDVYNTTEYFVGDRTQSPYYQPNKAYVNLKDTLPGEISNLKAALIYYDDEQWYKGDAIMGNTDPQSGSGTDLAGWDGATINGISLGLDLVDIPGVTSGDIEINDVMVPPNGKVTVKLVMTTEELERNIEPHENKVELQEPTRNINYGPDHSETREYLNKVLDHGTVHSSSDYIILNEYHAVITKYLQDYEPLITYDNNSESKGFTDETNEAYIEMLNNRIRLTYTEEEKYNHPVNVEKNEYVTWSIQVSNLSKDEPVEERSSYKDLSNPGKPKTQVRPTTVNDYLQEGLDIEDVTTDIYAKIYTLNADGTVGDEVTRYGEDIPVTVTDLGTVTRNAKADADFNSTKTQNFKKYSLEIADKYILNPDECIIYYVRTKVTKSNMYLYRLENQAELGVLTNVNCNEHSVGGEHDRIVKEDDEDHGQNVAGLTVTHQNDDEKYYKGVITSRDYVKLKDLVIAGKVWVDNTPDGLYALQSGDISGSSVDSDKLKANVTVKLYTVINGTAVEFRRTKTNEQGIYTFGRDINLAYYSPANGSANEYTITGNGGYNLYAEGSEPEGESGNLVSYESRQRISRTTPIVPMVKEGNIKDTNDKNDYLNYNANVQYARYFIEFEYDGLYYKATDLYAYDENLAENGEKNAWTPLTVDGDSENPTVSTNNDLKYVNDSNAYEFWDDRKEFDSNYETIGYDIAYAGGNENVIGDEPTMKDNDDTELLEYEKIATFESSHFKDGDLDESLENYSAHVSELLEREELEEYPDRKMIARSFIHGDPEYIDGKVNKDVSENTKYEEVNRKTSEVYYTDTDDFSNTNTLFLFDLSQDDYKLPETEYLKYINLGLVKREKVDISLVKDVYQVKVTVNGEEIIYTFNEEKVPVLTSGDDTILRKLYQSENGYSIELYEDDYNYRYNNYQLEKVREYKTALSEMYVEVTYRITIINNSVMDRDTDESFGTESERDIPLYVRINEIADYYDDNFIKYTDQAESTDSTKLYNHKEFDTLPQNPSIDWDGYNEGNNYVAMKKKNGDFLETKQVKVAEAWRYADESNERTRIDLEVHNNSVYNSKREIEGYNTLYIRGLDGNTSENVIDDGGIKLYEKNIDAEHPNSVNLYVKYVIDKEDSYYSLDDQDSGYKVLEALRQLKVFEKYDDGEAITTLPGQRDGFSGQENKPLNDTMQIKDLGIEGISEVNAYSTYYVELGLTDEYDAFYAKRYQYKHYADRPAGTVDRDSNPSNIGERPTSKSYIDSAPTYGSVLSKFNAEPGEAAIYYEDDTFKNGVRFVLPVESRLRAVNGMVWDDTRNEVVDEDALKSTDARKQYNGNGLYSPSEDTKNPNAQANGNIRNLYDELDDNDTKDSGFKDEIEKANEFDGTDISKDKYETTDFLVNEVKSQLIEIVKIPIYDDSNNLIELRYYEEPARKKTYGYDEQTASYGWSLSEITNRTGEDNDTGKYKLSGFVPGYYIVRFFYGDETSPEMLTYNGQDYKSTKYTAAYEPKEGEEEGESVENFTLSSGARYDDDLERVVYRKDDLPQSEIPLQMIMTGYVKDDSNDERYSINIETDGTDPAPTLAEKYDAVLKALTTENRNDARDDEISRLDAVGYSEVMTNAKAEILKGISSQTQYINNANKNIAVSNLTKPLDQQEQTVASSTILKGDQLFIQNANLMNSELVENTAMNAETVTFYVKPERVNEQTLYSGREKLEGDDRKTRDDDRNIYQINNIDFGLAYRPEAQITLDKEIESIIITTSDNTDILKVAFKDQIVSGSVIIDEFTGRMKRIVDLDNSIGLDKLQYLFNEDPIRAQGFFYINIDDEILQGCTINIEYALRAENISEIDRISSNLDILRYKENVTDAVLNSIGDHYVNIGLTNPFRFESGLVIKNTEGYLTYSGSKTAEGLLYDKWFEIDSTHEADREYRKVEKTMTQDENNKYYGSFLGGAYYTNKVLRVSSDQDEVIDTYVDLKIDTILDYLDNDLVFDQDQNNDIDHRWVPTTAEYLYKGDDYNGRLIKNTSLSLNKAQDGVTDLYDYDDHGRVIDIVTRNPIDVVNTDVFTIYDKDDVSYEKESLSNLIISVDDRVVDDQYTTSSLYSDAKGLARVGAIGTVYKDKTNLITTNPSLSRYLEPKVEVDLSDEITNVKDEATYYKTQKYNLNIDTKDQYAGKIFLTGKRVIAEQTDTENLVFDNIAEVIQYSITNGRRTNFKTTLGDAEVSKHVDENNQIDETKPQTVYEESLISHKHDPNDPTNPSKEIREPKDPDTSAVELITLSPPTGLNRIQRIIRSVVNTTSEIVAPLGIGVIMFAMVSGTIWVIGHRGKKRIK